MDLLGDHDLVDKCLAQCGLHRHQVEDICPATPFQQMLAKDAVAVAAWSYQCVFEVIGDTERAISAFQLVLAGNAILRTRLVRPDPVDAKTYQVVEHPSNDRITKVDIGLDDYIRRDQAKRIAYGQPLTRLALVTNSGKNYIVLSWVSQLF